MPSGTLESSEQPATFVLLVGMLVFLLDGSACRWELKNHMHVHAVCLSGAGGSDPEDARI